VIGNAGDNVLTGKDGKNSLTGGGGVVFFRLNTAIGSSNFYTITDFKVDLDSAGRLAQGLLRKLFRSAKRSTACVEAMSPSSVAASMMRFAATLDEGAAGNSKTFSAASLRVSNTVPSRSQRGRIKSRDQAGLV
jgi:hypothetical protein